MENAIGRSVGRLTVDIGRLRSLSAEKGKEKQDTISRLLSRFSRPFLGTR